MFEDAVLAQPQTAALLAPADGRARPESRIEMQLMRTIIAGFLSVSLFAVVPAVGQQGGAANTLSIAEQKDGFELLFDGKTLDKFIVPADQQKVWRVVDSVIRNEQAAPGATILTKEDYANFVVRAEFRAHPGVNSALMLRQGRPRPAGYELQIRDKVLTDRTGGEFLTGSIVNVLIAARGHDHPSRTVEHGRGDVGWRPHRRDL